MSDIEDVKPLGLDGPSGNKSLERKLALDKKPISLSIIGTKELGELKKQSTLSPTQMEIISSAQNEASRALKLMSSLPKSFTDARDISKMSSAIASTLKLPPIYHPSKLDNAIFNNYVPPASSTQQYKQTLILESIALSLEAQNAERNADIQKLLRPSYDAKTRKLIFGNKIIDIPAGDQEALCKVLFRNGKPNKPVDIGDALIKMGVPIDQIRDNKKAHYTKANLNKTIAMSIQVKDLFVIEDKQISVNKKYI